jgi:hypothetical protein
VPRHGRHYTLEQANATLGWVTERVERVRGAREALRGLGQDGLERIKSLDPQLGGSYPSPEAAMPLVTLSLALRELEALDIVVRDLERGLIDFPAMRDGDEVYLCWLIGEPEVGFWHGLDAGFAGRRPL